MGANNGDSQTAPGGQQAYSDEEVRQESSEAAQKSLEAQQAAYELKQAARGAGDPEERQKLLEEALDREIEAESFGKTAKYLRSGTFQGFAMGTGMGIAPGASLGAITGTLVGGVASLVTGGLGGAIGAGVGAIHGPFFNMGEVTGKGIQKITGNLPGWKATWEQKQALESMIEDVRKQDMPDKGELESMKRDRPKKTWGQSAASMMPSMSWPSWGKSKKDNDRGKDSNASQSASYSTFQARRDPASVRRVDEQGISRLQEAQARAEQERTRPRAAAKTSSRNVQQPPGTQQASSQPTPHQAGQQGPRRKPRKLEVRNAAADQTPDVNKDSQPARKKPRKLEARTKPVASAG